MLNSRDAYLTYQAEIGTEEVILPHPWIRKISESKNRTPESIPGIPESISTRTRHTVAPEPPRPSPAPIPEFKDFDAYWKYVAEEYSRQFTFTLPLAHAEGIANPVLALVELAPSQSPTPRVFDGGPGLLLDKMLKAIHLDRSRLYLTSVMKVPAPGKSWARRDIARMLPFLFQELRLAACSTVLLLGEPCAQSVLRTGKSLEALRQQAVEYEGLVFAASYHPVDLDDNHELKKKAWEDLKWLKMRLGMREDG